jgi:tripartite-type tricarboxylate transporter receptor subunit TctC
MQVHRAGRLLVPPVLILLLAAAAGYASAQEYPTRPVRLIVPSSPGGGTDASARIVQPRLSELLGQPIVVENRPGASGWIGAEAVLRAPHDGHALLMTNATLAVSQSSLKKPPLDPLRDLAPVTQMARVPQMIGGHPSLPPRNVKELIAFMKARPGAVDFSAGNYGGHPHVTMVLFMNMTGISGNFVPYKSGNAGLVDGLSGEVPLLVGNLLVTLPHVRAGRLRAFGVTTAKRAAAAPDIPTIAEAGVPGYESEQWFGVMVRAATPRPVIDRLHRELLKVLQENRTKERFIADGGEVAWSRTPDDFGAMLRAEIVKWAKVVKAAGIKPE